MDMPAIDGPITRREAVLTSVIFTIASIVTAKAFETVRPEQPEVVAIAETKPVDEPFQLAF